jgi:nucleotide-binding universal stress UspA family protein
MNILYATDGSECAAAAGRLLAALPLPAGAQVTVLSAVPELGWIETPVLPEVAEQAAEEELTAAVRVAEAAAAPFRERGLRVRVTAQRRSAGDAILDEAMKEGADLIVVGSQGKGAIERFLIGSVSERVARSAHCPVLVARGDTIHRAIIGVDGSEATEHALDVLALLPLPPEIETMMIHVLRPGDLPPPLLLGPGSGGETAIDAFDREQHAMGERIARHAQAHFRHAGHEAATEVRCGAPAEELIAAARDCDADLIVVGAANK